MTAAYPSTLMGDRVAAITTDGGWPPSMVTRTARRRWLLVVERACWVLGLAGLAWWGAFQVGVLPARRGTIWSVSRQLRASTPPTNPSGLQRASAPGVQAMAEPAPAPLAVLRIPKIRLEVAVLPGTDDRTLDRGVGHIEDTAQPGTDGNLGIAGHRDGFFRGLKDIVPGDLIELDTLQGTDAYRVERTWVVSPEDVSVLDPTPTRAITLVTCYPVLLRRLRPRTVHRPRSARRRQPHAFAGIRCAHPCPFCGGLRFVSFF